MVKSEGEMTRALGKGEHDMPRCQIGPSELVYTNASAFLMKPNIFQSAFITLKYKDDAITVLVTSKSLVRSTGNPNCSLVNLGSRL